jgi:hypothetical protein
MWGRKAKRIRELEEQLVDARENVARVNVQIPRGMVMVAEVRRGVWHTVSYRFMVDQTLKNVDFGDVSVVANELTPYFDGSTPPPDGYDYRWVGDVTPG